jgi:hypothetical protein
MLGRCWTLPALLGGVLIVSSCGTTRVDNSIKLCEALGEGVSGNPAITIDISKKKFYSFDVIGDMIDCNIEKVTCLAGDIICVHPKNLPKSVKKEIYKGNYIEINKFGENHNMISVIIRREIQGNKLEYIYNYSNNLELYSAQFISSNDTSGRSVVYVPC